MKLTDQRFQEAHDKLADVVLWLEGFSAAARKHDPEEYRTTTMANGLRDVQHLISEIRHMSDNRGGDPVNERLKTITNKERETSVKTMLDATRPKQAHD